MLNQKVLKTNRFCVTTQQNLSNYEYYIKERKKAEVS